MSLSFIIYIIIGLFFLILIARNFFPKNIKNKICSICLAFAITWIFLLFLKFQGNFNDEVFIGILMGMTGLGIFYSLEKNIKKELTIFRLPFLLTIIFLFYFLLTLESLKKEFLIIGITWIVFVLVYLFKENKNLNKLFNKIVECCKNW